MSCFLIFLFFLLYIVLPSTSVGVKPRCLFVSRPKPPSITKFLPHSWLQPLINSSSLHAFLHGERLDLFKPPGRISWRFNCPRGSSLVHLPLATGSPDRGVLREEPLPAGGDREQRTSQRPQSPACGQEILCDRLPSSSFARQA